jgi:hypothetical protein
MKEEVACKHLLLKIVDAKWRELQMADLVQGT